jgi:hypothetical protein
VSKRRGTEPGYARRTPWLEAIREVASAWLEDEAKHSPSPHSRLAAWKGDRGMPAHVMLTLLRRLREHNPELMQTTFPAARVQRAQDIAQGSMGESWRSWWEAPSVATCRRSPSDGTGVYGRGPLEA